MSLQALLDGAVENGASPGFAAVVADRDGVKNEARAGEAGPDTVFKIASLTKAMTSVAALQLVERGELKLDQPVADVLPAFGELQILDGFDGDEPRLRAPARPPTITHLLTHTSGCGYWFANEDLLRWHELTGTPTLLDGKRAAIVTPLVHDAGERWTYGVSTDWLGQVVEALTGRSLDAQLKETVWGPLDMPDTTFFPSPEQRARVMPVRFRTADGTLGPLPFEEHDFEFCCGGGGAFSTARDYSRFQQTLLRGGELDGERILRPETVDLMFTDHLAGAPLPEVTRSAVPELTGDIPRLPFDQGWGLGLHVVLEDLPGMRRKGTGDWAGLYNCYYWIDRQTGICAVLMTQVLPFFDPQVIQTLLAFEGAVYSELAAPTPA